MTEGAFPSPAGLWSTGIALALIVLGAWLWRRARSEPEPLYWAEEISSLALFWTAQADGLPVTLHGQLAGRPDYPDGFGDFAVLLVAPLGGAQPPVRALVLGAGELRERQVAKRDFVALRGHLAGALGPPVRGRFRQRTWFLAGAADVETRPSRLPEELLA